MLRLIIEWRKCAVESPFREEIRIRTAEFLTSIGYQHTETGGGGSEEWLRRSRRFKNGRGFYR